MMTEMKAKTVPECDNCKKIIPLNKNFRIGYKGMRIDIYQCDSNICSVNRFTLCSLQCLISYMKRLSKEFESIPMSDKSIQER
jgi:hypothetical protein